MVIKYKAGDKVLWLSRTSPRETRTNKILRVNKTTVTLVFPQRYGKAETGTLDKKFIIKRVI